MNIYLLYEFDKGAKGYPVACCANAQAVVNYLSRFYKSAPKWEVEYRHDIHIEDLAKAIDGFLDNLKESTGVVLGPTYEKSDTAGMDDDGLKYIADMMNSFEPPRFIVFRKNVLE